MADIRLQLPAISLNFRLFSYSQRIVYFNAQIAHRAFQLGIDLL